MNAILCPGCQSALSPNAAACPVCLRPRSKQEIARALEEIRAPQGKSFGKDVNLSLIAAALAVAIYGFWRLHPAFSEPPSGPENPRANATAQTETEHPSALALAAKPSEERRALMPRRMMSPSTPQTDPARSPAAEPASRPRTRSEWNMPPLDVDAQWAVYGEVRDLITLRPVAETNIEFKADDGRLANEFTTDSQGRYVVVMSRDFSGRFTVDSADPRYSRIVLCEPDIPYQDLSLEKRENLVLEAHSEDLPQALIKDIVGEKYVRRDLFLAPRPEPDRR